MASVQDARYEQRRLQNTAVGWCGICVALGARGGIGWVGRLHGGGSAAGEEARHLLDGGMSPAS